MVIRPNTGGSNTRGNANVVNNLLILRMPYGENAGSSSNAGARIGLTFTGRNDGTGYIDNPSKSASIYGISEDGSAGYTRQMGLAFFTSGFDAAQTEKMRITNSGYVNIGGDYTQTSYNLSVTNTGGNLFRIKTADQGDYDLRFMIQNSEANIWHYGTDDFVFGNRYNRKLHFITNAQKRLTINGNLVGINETSPDSVLHVQGGTGSGNSSGVTFESGSGGTAAKIMFAVNGNNDRSKYIQHSQYWTEIGCHNNEGVRFRESDGDIRFYMNGASGNYNFTGSNISDRNLKENIETITTNSIDLIKQVIPRTFNWKFDRKNIPHGGFIAQEMQPLFPKLINGVEYDESRTDDGDPNEPDAGKCNPTGMGFDYNGYTAYLTKAMQELIAKVETLEAEVAVLKGS